MSHACAAPPVPPGKDEKVLSELPFFLPEKGQSVGIIGVSQNGKTSHGFKWCGALLQGGVRNLAWDPDWQWSKSLRQEGVELGPLEYSVTIDELEAEPELLLERSLSLAVRPVDRWAEDAEIAAQFVRFGRMVIRAHPGGRLALWIDESHILRALTEAMALLDAMALRWGKQGIVPFFITQRWTHLSADVRAEIAWLLSFHQNKDTDLGFLKRDAGRDFTRQVAGLKPYEYRARFLRKALPEVVAELG